MPTVKTIKPLGGGDFTTLAAWQVFAAAQATADQWAECYSGGNLGGVFMTAWASTPSATVYPRVYAEPGSRHDGNLGGASGTNGAYMLNTAPAPTFRSAIAFTELDGLVINKDAAASNAVMLTGADHTVRNCILRRNGGTAAPLLATDTAPKPTVQNVVYNNIFYFAPAVVAAGIPGVVVGNGNGTGGRGVFANNTVFNSLKALTSAVQINYLYGFNNESWIINNFVYGTNSAGGTYSFVDALDTGAYETQSFWSKNTTDDGGTAGYGDAFSSTASGPLTNYVASATDPHPLPGTILINTANDLNADATFGFSSADAVGTTRPFVLWDRGAIEYVAATSGGRRRRHTTEVYL
jgi:hypothetical protein